MLQDQVFLQCKQINETGVAILMVEQNARRCLQVCHRGYVLDQGRNAYTGTGRELLGDPKVIELYLGHPRPQRMTTASAGGASSQRRLAMAASPHAAMNRGRTGAGAPSRRRGPLACADDGPGDVAVATTLCPTVQAWSDATVDAVDGFRIASRELDPAARRSRYLQSFDERSRPCATDLPTRSTSSSSPPASGGASTRPSPVSPRSSPTVPPRPAPCRTRRTRSRGRDGSLVTGVEKAKAIVFDTLATWPTSRGRQSRVAAAAAARSTSHPPSRSRPDATGPGLAAGSRRQLVIGRRVSVTRRRRSPRRAALPMEPSVR